jgi:hypothetical protein
MAQWQWALIRPRAKIRRQAASLLLHKLIRITRQEKNRLAS